MCVAAFHAGVLVLSDATPAESEHVSLEVSEAWLIRGLRSRDASKNLEPHRGKKDLASSCGERKRPLCDNIKSTERKAPGILKRCAVERSYGRFSMRSVLIKI
jgi:hypothetical protein